MTLDTGTIAILVTVLLAILSLAAAWGSLGQRVNSQEKAIEANRKTAEADNAKLHRENREDHQQLFAKLEEIWKLLRNDKS